jgi:hypothetical protein
MRWSAHSAAFEAIREVCERGVAQGSIRKGVDVDLLAFQILQQAWGADMSVLMGLNEFLERFGRRPRPDPALDCAATALAAQIRLPGVVVLGNHRRIFRGRCCPFQDRSPLKTLSASGEECFQALLAPLTPALPL